jgi:hypothetical protein
MAALPELRCKSLAYWLQPGEVYYGHELTRLLERQDA